MRGWGVASGAAPSLLHLRDSTQPCPCLCRRYVMPDKRTVYITDDSTNGMFLKFVADAAGDLSSGRLYAAKMTQTR